MSLSDVKKSDYGEEEVLNYFLYLTRKLEGIGGQMPSIICTKTMLELIEDDATKEDAFDQALKQLREFTPIGDDE